MVACSSAHKNAHQNDDAANAAATTVSVAQSQASATLDSKSGSKIEGTVEFEETANGLKVSYNISGLKPNQMHGFHVHEKGDCSSADAKSAGTHYAPVAPTGGTSLETPQKFAGDLPMIKADASGRATGSLEVASLSINGQYGVKDRAIMVHGGPDNPKKKSAPRVGCGVIKLTQASI